MTIRAWLSQARNKLQNVNIASAQLDSELLLAIVFNKERTWLLAHDDQALTNEALQHANKLLERRLNREPIAYLRGWQEFYGRSFIVTPATLIPRPESETIITLLKELHPHGTLVDTGTGSGALAITLALEMPELTITATDISPDALIVARENARHLAPHSLITFQQSDLLTSLPGQFNTVVANLPYVSLHWERSPETAFEPAIALYAKDDGLELITRLIQETQQKLVKNGLLVIEADPRQFDAIISYASVHYLALIKREGFVLVFRKS